MNSNAQVSVSMAITSHSCCFKAPLWSSSNYELISTHGDRSCIDSRDCIDSTL